LAHTKGLSVAQPLAATRRDVRIRPNRLELMDTLVTIT
jgi:hypothetical protein